MAKYCTAPAENCFKLPNNVSFKSAALLDCIAVAIHAVNRAQICNGDRVVITGSGTIGLLLLQVALLRGVDDVYAIGKH